MIRRQGELKAEEKEVLQNGSGAVLFNYVLEQEKGEFFGKGRLFSVLTIKPGCSIGYHVHKGEMEVYYVLSGKAKLNDNGVETELRTGDTSITMDGEGHSVENDTDEDFVMLALILFTN